MNAWVQRKFLLSPSNEIMCSGKKKNRMEELITASQRNKWEMKTASVEQSGKQMTLGVARVISLKYELCLY